MRSSLSLALIGVLALGEIAHAAVPRRPNVILILADDLGYECIGANGGTSYRTPVLDALAAQGVRFTHCYVQPLCTPTRAQLMTGIYNVRNYVRFGHLDPQATTFGHLFKNSGYATCVVGKWQLGQDVNLPRSFGFDEACLWQHTRRPERYRNPGLEINGVERNYTNGEYGPDLVNDYACDFIRRKKDSPFFLYYPMMLTHSPYVPTPDSPDYGKEDQGKKPVVDAQGVNRHFKAMVEYMDKLIGKLVRQVDELGLRDSTLIVFLADNGTGRGTRSLMGERVVIGGKGKTTITGMHVPLIVSWPGTAVPRVCDDLVDSTDVLPTICEAAGIPVPAELKIDGRSFLPQVRGQKGQPREWYYCWFSRNGDAQQVREFAANHRYKLYRNGEFYDLMTDPDEERPMKVSQLTGEAAAAAKTLQAALDQYRNARPARLLNSQ
ncbi:MAG: sulfatase-like hydrolase/transferase [Gemmataceae bacterium]|nr:sulfatase-like hydrolase/transferase [Gemmataceae bacterium]MDW8266323.1 sulfatase-like hydrolase/transferase [Gemmataceae bacterium]